MKMKQNPLMSVISDECHGGGTWPEKRPLAGLIRGPHCPYSGPLLNIKIGLKLRREVNIIP